jgi:hypothetical protein
MSYRVIKDILTQSLTPELLEPGRIGGRVLDGVLNVPMPEIVLNEPRIGSLVGKSKAAGVAQHVGMGEQRQGGGLAVCPQKQIDGRAVQRLAPLADKERLHARANLPPGAVFQPGADGPQLVGSQRLRRRQPAFQPAHMQHAAFAVHLVERQPAGLRHAQAMPEHQEQQAAVAGPVAAAFGGVDQLFHLEAGEVLATAVLFLPAARRARFSCFPSAHRFVESLSCRRPRKPAPNGWSVFRVSTKCLLLSRDNPKRAGQGTKGT